MGLGVAKDEVDGNDDMYDVELLDCLCPAGNDGASEQFNGREEEGSDSRGQGRCAVVEGVVRRQLDETMGPTTPT